MSDQIPSIDDILKDGLRRIGAEGLCHPDTECGCGLDDFRPCRSCPMECVPAVRDRSGVPQYDSDGNLVDGQFFVPLGTPQECLEDDRG